MRPLTVSAIRGKRKTKRKESPAEGSVARRVYDALLTGLPVLTREFRDLYPHGSNFHATVGYLQDFYGMEIDRPSKSTYILVGVWDGPDLVPLERVNIEDLEA